MAPWTFEDFKQKNKDFTDAQAKIACKVANSALAACLDKGKEQDECEVSAIKQGLNVGARLKEGMLADEVAAQKAESEVNDFIWKAQSLIGDVMRDITMNTQIKKDKISGILDDLDVELTKRADTVAILIKRRTEEMSSET